MNTNLSPSFRKLAVAGVLSAMALAFVVATTQSRSEAAPRPAGDQVASISKGPKIDTEQYTVELKAVGEYKAGQQGVAELVITPKGDYHINDKFPIKFKVADPASEGVSYPKPLLKREDGKFETTRGSLQIPFVVSKSGKAKVAGVFSVSVCSDKNCLMEKLDLELDVDVK